MKHLSTLPTELLLLLTDWTRTSDQMEFHQHLLVKR
jgi:hypothetical protein